MTRGSRPCPGLEELSRHREPAGGEAPRRQRAWCVSRTKQGRASGKEAGREVERGGITLSLRGPGIGSGFFQSTGKSSEDFHLDGFKD